MTVDDFINRMLVLYGAPETADPDLFFDEYRASLRGTAPALLQATAEVIRDTHQRRSWPVPGEIKAAMHKAASIRASKHPEAPEQPVRWGDAGPAERARVAALVAEFTETMASQDYTIARNKKMGTDVSRPAFEAMQHNITNQYLHLKPGSLTDKSKAMAGD